MRIPFDNVALSAVLSELESFVGGTVQEVRQPDEHTITLQLYRRSEGAKGREGVVLFSTHPQFARVHFTTRRLPNASTPPVFCATLRARLNGAELSEVVQVASDRILLLSFEAEAGRHRIVCELMGKHSNLMLIDERNHVVAAAKWVPKTQSTRPIVSDTEYNWPPVLEESLLARRSPKTPTAWRTFATEHPARVSPFFRTLAPFVSEQERDWSSVLVQGSGAYPIDLKPIGLDGFPRASFSIALEQHYTSAEAAWQIENVRTSLTSQIDRVIASRELAIADVERTLEVGAEADHWQMIGQLILAFGPSARLGNSSIEAFDYEGQPVSIEVDPTLGYVENSSRYFERAKKAKAKQGYLVTHLARLIEERGEAIRFREKVQDASLYKELLEFQQTARTRRWLVQQTVAATKEERPYEGHRIRELSGPGGVRVLFGENAESNDYLTLRVAKPNDYWLHVRGSTSAHVVLVTGNAPDRIGKEQLLFAAKIAVLNSTSKHAGYVPVDYTLKKYVRKPRGAAKGSAVYTNEKTLHIES